jgi:ubiquitin carboxyl-terminal hydrolase 22/27/51
MAMGQDVINNSIQHYRLILRAIFDQEPLIVQTSKGTETSSLAGIVHLTPTSLCLQCSIIVPEEERNKHASKKQHRFCGLLAALHENI